MKSIDLCRDCQQERPAYIAGRMYKRCLDCLRAYDAKREANRQAKMTRVKDQIAFAVLS